MKFTEKQIRMRVKQIPQLPDVAMRVLRIHGDPNVSVHDIVDIVKYDQGITSKLIKVCNSPFFGLTRPITSVRDAMVYVGQKTFLNLICTMCSGGLLKKKFDGYFLEPGELWKHSVASAICSQIISTRIKMQKAESAFTAGLLHDIGKIVMNTLIMNKDEEIMKLIEEKEVTFLEAEKEIVGFDHCEIGGFIAEEWKFPVGLTEVIKYHHVPHQATQAESLVHTVHLANIVCLSEGIGVGMDGMAVEMSPTINQHIELTSADMDNIALELNEKMKTAGELISA